MEVLPIAYKHCLCRYRCLFAHALDNDGNDIFSSYTVHNNLHGCNKLARKILNKALNLKVDEIQISMEATNVFWFHPYRYLAEYEPLNNQFNLPMFRLNPKVVRNFKKAYNSLPKTDSVDAWVIADRLRFGRVNPSMVISKTYEPLRQSTRFHFQLNASIRAEKNRALNLIFLKFSNYDDKAPFSTFSKASEALLKNFSPDQIAHKLVRLVYALLSKGKIYKPRR